jgi:iron-sulfur cluster assembly protein
MIEITQTAADVIVKMVARNGLPGGGGLRVGVKAGGCSGFSYIFGWEPGPGESDRVFEAPNGARVFVDDRSLRLLDGTTLDYDTGLISKGFIFNNPNATGTCGCGTSFSV